MPERYKDEGLFGRTWHGGDWNNAISREILDLQRKNKALAEQNRAPVKRAADLAELVRRLLDTCCLCRRKECQAAHAAVREAVQQATGKEAI